MTLTLKEQIKLHLSETCLLFGLRPLWKNCDVLGAHSMCVPVFVFHSQGTDQVSHFRVGTKKGLFVFVTFVKEL